MREGYDTAQICMNGHVITATAETKPQFRKAYCDKCGEPTIMECPNCKAGIQGRYRAPAVAYLYSLDAPNFCHGCGSSFPWTERKKNAAVELFAEEIQDEQDRRDFKENMDKISRDTPDSQVAGYRITKLLKKVGTHAGSMIRDIAVEIASETAKKAIFPDR